MLQVLVRVLAMSQGVQFLKLQFQWTHLVRRCYEAAKQIQEFCDDDDYEALSITLVFAGQYGHHINTLGREQITACIIESAKLVESMREQLEQINVEPEAEKIPEPDEESGDEEENDNKKSWDMTLVSTFSLSAQAKKALEIAGLVTVRDVITFEAGGGSLASLNGVSATAEKIIQEQIASMKPAEGS